MSENPTPLESIPPAKSPRSNRRLKFIGGGCLLLLLCLVGVPAACVLSGGLAGPRGTDDIMPSWSADGKHIAFASNRAGNFDIHVMDADGSHVKQLTHDLFNSSPESGDADQYDPAWSPDGRHLAMRSRQATPYGPLDTLYVMSDDGRDRVRLNTSRLESLSTCNMAGFSNEMQPVWSPDGTRIAFAKKCNYWWGIVVMTLDGQTVSNLGQYYEVARSPTWSPDGSRIAFASTFQGNWDIYAMDSDGSNHVLLMTDTWNEDHPAWSPDGSQVAFASQQGGASVIYAMDTDGSNMVPLTTPWDDNDHPTWSPDGQHIAFESDRDGDFDIYVMDADGSNVVQLTGK